MRWWWLMLGAGCAGGEPGEDDGRRRAGSEDSGETDSDTDTDTGDPPPAPAPCPFEGSWVLAEATCAEPLDLVGTAEVTGSADLCRVVFDVVVDGDCPVVETVELHAQSFDFWQGYTDGAPGVGSCRYGTPGARPLGPVQVLQEGSSVVISFNGQGEHYLQITACTGGQTLTLER